VFFYYCIRIVRWHDVLMRSVTDKSEGALALTLRNGHEPPVGHVSPMYLCMRLSAHRPGRCRLGRSGVPRMCGPRRARVSDSAPF
jgi:hypothetical protein